MTKSELILRIGELNPHLYHRDVERIVVTIFDEIATALARGDIAGAYAGVRPLISASADPKTSVDISRKAELYEPADGFVTITGGKLTTWRRMAKMTVDRIVEMPTSRIVGQIRSAITETTGWE